MLENKENARRYITHSVAVFALIVLLSSFFSSDNNYIKVQSSPVDFSKGWCTNNSQITLPYTQSDTFTVTNTLPQIMEEDYLVLKCRYDKVVVSINRNIILNTRDSYYLGHVTNAGNKELIIPLKPEYSNCDITICVDLHSSFYLTSFYDAKILSAGEYINELIQNNVMVLFLGTIFLTTGFAEVMVAVYMLLFNVKTRRSFSIEALLYAGLFSITTSIWAMLYTRLPAVLTGNMILPSIIGYICFLLMPLNFIGMVSALDDHKNPVLNFAVAVSTIVVVVEFILNLLGIMDWAQTTFTCHVLDAAGIIAALIMAFKTITSEEKLNDKAFIIVGNGIFVVMCAIALVKYVQDRETGFMNLFIIALMIYVVSFVMYVANKMRLTAAEAEDYKVTQVYAYTDGLTGLGNRRQYWNMIKQYNIGGITNDFTVIYMDVNRLKYVNDNFGHEAGDELLIGAAECIDKIFKDAIKCRIGGDEFALIIPKPEKNIDKLVYDFKQEVKKWKGKRVDTLSVAVGVASLKDNKGAKIDELCRIADNNMYADKRDYYEASGIDRRDNEDN